jgi:hydroxymethylpyrimidine/phosphomethylpyrimidine kinase
MRGRVLAIGGSDSGGGAGIQADIKTITALGGYAMTAITAVTVQDTRAVHAVHAVPADFLRWQIVCALDDPGADAIKIGMLGSADAVVAVHDVLAAKLRGLPVVLDPVLRATTGRALLDEAGLAELKGRLLPLAAVLTPNLPEAEMLTGMTIADEAAMHAAATALMTFGVSAVLLKGGHLPGEEVVDVLASGAGIKAFHARRIESRHTHGTGCTLASAVAVGLAQGMGLEEAVHRARLYVRSAIATAPGYGQGMGRSIMP